MRMHTEFRFGAWGTIVMLCIAVFSQSGPAAEPAEKANRAAVLKDSYGTYNAPPRQKDGRVDVKVLAAELQSVHANTYNWLVWHAATDWEDLQLFLALVQGRDLRVWVTLVPPSESPPKTKNFSEPFRLDYERWGMEIAELSLRHTNLVAWSLDDFSHNAAVLPPERMRSILTKSREINSRLAFVPCCYFRHITPQYAAKYLGVIDGILFPYRNESGEMNLSDSGAVESEVAKLKTMLGQRMPIFIDVYATRHSRLKDSSPEYVREVMLAGRRVADGVLIYCHQYEASSPAKHAVIKELFGEWSKAGGQARQERGQ